MKNFITSTWFALIVGGLAFLATLIFALKSQQPRAVQASESAVTPQLEQQELSAAPEKTPIPVTSLIEPITISLGGDPQSINNSEVIKLLSELRLEKQALLQWEKELQELKRRLDVEMAELTSITQEMLQTKTELEKMLQAEQLHLRSEETNRFHNLSRVYTNMPPANAVQIFKQMPVDDVAKIMYFMGDRESAAILQVEDPNRAAEISERVRRIAREPEPAPTTR